MPCECRGICDSIPRPSDSIGYKDPLFSYCGICQRPFLNEKYRCDCCRGSLRKSSRYNPEAPSKMKVQEFKN